MTPLPFPTLRRVPHGECVLWTDPPLHASGVLVAFTERGGGGSAPPYDSLNLACHVGDRDERVDENRRIVLSAAGIGGWRDRLTMAVQVHGDTVAVVDAAVVGSGAYCHAGKQPVSAADALLTSLPGVPLALCFADCVPIILVAPGPTVAVAHAGWRGALASLPGIVVRRVAEASGCGSAEVHAYVGAHIGARHYAVDDSLMSQFVNTFGTLARADSGGLDLDAVVSASLDDAGVAPCNIARLGLCTAEATDRFFSYRAEATVTGRHAALVCIL